MQHQHPQHYHYSQQCLDLDDQRLVGGKEEVDRYQRLLPRRWPPEPIDIDEWKLSWGYYNNNMNTRCEQPRDGGSTDAHTMIMCDVGCWTINQHLPQLSQWQLHPGRPRHCLLRRLQHPLALCCVFVCRRGGGGDCIWG